MQTDTARKTRRSRSSLTPETLRKWTEEEPHLIAAWQQDGCAASLTTLLQRYTPLISKEVGRVLTGRSLSETHKTDLFQEAMLAFVKAVSDYRPESGNRLSTYAGSGIRGALLTYALDNRNTYRIGTSSDERKAFYAALRHQSRKIAAGDMRQLDESDIQQIQKSTGASEKATRRAVSAVYTRMATLEAAAEIPEEDSPQEYIRAKLSQKAAMDVLAPFIETLDPRQRAILSQMLSPTQEDDTNALSRKFGITPARVGQIRREMLTAMRKHLLRNGISPDSLF